MSDLSWLTTVFCPLLGVLISNARGMAPVKALIAARRNKKLGEQSFGPAYSMEARTVLLGKSMTNFAASIFFQDR